MTRLAFSTFALFALSAVFAAPAHATTINVTKPNMGTVSDGQTGTVTTMPHTYGPPTDFTAYDSAYGYLPPDSEIIFTYSITGGSFSNVLTSLFGYGSYDYKSGGYEYAGQSRARQPGFEYSFGTKAHGGWEVPSTALVIATSTINNPTSSNPTSGTVTISNSSAGKAYFLAAIDAFNFGGSAVVTYVVKSLAAVPLPAALPMFGFAMIALGGLAYRRRQAAR